jgi:hypothetical protein
MYCSHNTMVDKNHLDYTRVPPFSSNLSTIASFVMFIGIHKIYIIKEYHLPVLYHVRQNPGSEGVHIGYTARYQLLGSTNVQFEVHKNH